MKLLRGDRWTLHGVVVGCVGAGVIMVFPTHPEVGWFLIVGGVLTSILAEMNQRWPGPLDAVVGRLRGGSSFIPLEQAARQLYEANLNDTLGRWARDEGRRSESEILEWLAYWMDGRQLPIYGTRAPSTVLEQIPHSVLRRGGLVGGAKLLMDGSMISYRQLSVKRGEFTALMEKLGETEDPLRD